MKSKIVTLVKINLFKDGKSYFCTSENVTDLLVKQHLQNIYENLYELYLYKDGLFSQTLDRCITYKLRSIHYIKL